MQDAVRLNNWLGVQGLPRQTLGFLEDLLAGRSLREGLREMLLQLRCETHEKHYGIPPSWAQIQIMRRRSEEDAAKADLGDAR